MGIQKGGQVGGATSEEVRAKIRSLTVPPYTVQLKQDLISELDVPDISPEQIDELNTRVDQLITDQPRLLAEMPLPREAEGAAEPEENRDIFGCQRLYPEIFDLLKTNTYNCLLYTSDAADD